MKRFDSGRGWEWKEFGLKGWLELGEGCMEVVCHYSRDYIYSHFP